MEWGGCASGEKESQFPISKRIFGAFPFWLKDVAIIHILILRCITHCNFASVYVRNCISEYQFGIGRVSVWESVCCSFIHYHCEMDERRNEEQIKRKAESVQFQLRAACMGRMLPNIISDIFERCNHFVNGHICLGLFSYANVVYCIFTAFAVECKLNLLACTLAQQYLE